MGSLNELMEFDHVIHVGADGAITEPPGVWAPEMNDHQLEASYENDGWRLLSGFTGQYGYNGPCMHPSEFIGGDLEDHIRETPGYWVALVCEEWPDDDGEPELCGWVVAHKES